MGEVVEHVVLRPTGYPFEPNTLTGLHRSVEQALQEDVNEIDLGRFRWLSAGTLGAFVQSSQQAHYQGVNFRLEGVGEAHERVLRVSGLLDLLSAG